MLIATAGHVDHGKTTLIRALTGVDTDRLPDEKRRGVSIDLGFAYQATPGGPPIGFVDVPGHERFIRNMLAGVGAVDAVLLIVAADDGPMPQTREHLAIVNLLGIRRGAIVLTRTDLVDDQTRERAIAQCRALVASSTLSDVPVFPVSAPTGDGIPALQAFISDLASQSAHPLYKAEPGDDKRWRMAIDRQFSVAGSGLVVTGTVVSGHIAVGEPVSLAPRGGTARIRGIRVHDKPAEIASAGFRCALNLNASDLGRSVPQRGDWLTSEPPPMATDRLDIRLRVLPSEARPLKHWTPVHVHLGTAALTGRIALLDSREVPPGHNALAQLVLNDAVHAIRNDRLVLRDQSAQRTIGGGSVIDPFGPARGRARPERIAVLRTIEKTPANEALNSLLAHQLGGISLDWLGQTWNLAPGALAALRAQSDAVDVEMANRNGKTHRVLVARSHWQQVAGALLGELGAWHKQHPDRTGPTATELRRLLAGQFDRQLVQASLAELVTTGQVVRLQTRVHLPGHAPTQTVAQAQLWQQIAPALAPDVLRPAVVTDLARQLSMDKVALEQFLSGAAHRGQLVRFAPNRYFHPAALATLASKVHELGRAQPDGFAAKAYRDASGIGRNLTIELLEYFDAHGLTRRIGDRRLVVGNARELFGEPPAA